MKWYVCIETQKDGKDYVGICEYYGGEESQEGFVSLHDSEDEADAACREYSEEHGISLFEEYRELLFYRKYYGEKQPELISSYEAIGKLEGHGYYKPGTVKKLLEAGEILRTNAAEYYCSVDMEKPQLAGRS